MSNQPSLSEYGPTRSTAQAVLDMIDASLLVLDSELRVSSANGGFCRMFGVPAEDLRGRPLYELGGGHWDTPDLRLTLDAVVSGCGSLHACEMEREFPGMGPRNMLLDVRRLPDSDDAGASVLLAITDITETRAAEKRMTALLAHRGMLLEEMTHRVANSLTIIAGILILKARRIRDVEARGFLEETHHRVISIATAQRLLKTSLGDADVKLAPYLAELCESLATSMVSDRQKVVVEVIAGDGTAPSADAVSLGLIVTELVINALKYAFVSEVSGGRVTVTYTSNAGDWVLTVADNGIGSPARTGKISKAGLGTVIVEALATQLVASVNVAIGAKGRTTTLTHVAT